jgi:hypothetical protein
MFWLVVWNVWMDVIVPASVGPDAMSSPTTTRLEKTNDALGLLMIAADRSGRYRAADRSGRDAARVTREGDGRGCFVVM